MRAKSLADLYPWTSGFVFVNIRLFIDNWD